MRPLSSTRSTGAISKGWISAWLAISMSSSSAPVQRVFFAGEHTSLAAMATAHGAYMSGIEAAHRAAETVGYAPLEFDPPWLPERAVQPV